MRNQQGLALEAGTWERNQRIRLFVSSTFRDMQHERRALASTHARITRKHTHAHTNTHILLLQQWACYMNVVPLPARAYQIHTNASIYTHAHTPMFSFCHRLFVSSTRVKTKHLLIGVQQQNPFCISLMRK